VRPAARSGRDVHGARRGVRYTGHPEIIEPCRRRGPVGLLAPRALLRKSEERQAGRRAGQTAGRGEGQFAPLNLSADNCRESLHCGWCALGRCRHPSAAEPVQHTVQSLAPASVSRLRSMASKSPSPPRARGIGLPDCGVPTPRTLDGATPVPGTPLAPPAIEEALLMKTHRPCCSTTAGNAVIHPPDCSLIWTRVSSEADSFRNRPPLLRQPAWSRGTD
jgi:hypothetical protein